jgi:hypothetical protein
VTQAVAAGDQVAVDRGQSMSSRPLGEPRDPGDRRACSLRDVDRDTEKTQEEGHAHRRLCELGRRQRVVARAVRRGQSHVSRRLTILQLPKEALRELGRGG